jgi:hypothetical protein
MGREMIAESACGGNPKTKIRKRTTSNQQLTTSNFFGFRISGFPDAGSWTVFWM